MVKLEYIQTFGKKKTAVAIAYVKKGDEGIMVNGVPIELVEPAPLRAKLIEPILILGKDLFEGFTFKIKTRGGGHISQLYAVRQAIAKGIVAYHQKYVDEASKKLIKDKLLNYDRSLLVADQRRKEPKKFGGPGARAKYQKSYR